jgi:hypothetical protein
MMTADQIPSFVQEVVDAGCDIIALTGGSGFFFGDADLSAKQYELAEPHIHAICAKYGRWDHLLTEISQYLVSIGRVYVTPPIWPRAPC